MRVSKTPELGSTPSAPADNKKYHPITIFSYETVFFYCVILLSDTLETPALDNLWDYLSHFYSKVPSAVKEQFLFEDLAGIYTENGSSKLFAVCIQYADIPSLRILPKGEYLCADCTEENREAALHELIQEARITYSIEPKFTIQLVVVSDILHWDYQIQIPLC